MSEPQQGILRRPVIFATRVLGIERDELVAVAWSFVYFFCIMSGYFMLRSIRETMAIISGVQNIPFLFSGTFVLMLLATPVFGWIASRYPRRTFLPWVYYFFVANILIFFAVFSYALANDFSIVWTSRVFFVWLSVFNLFVVSVFWSFMADIYTKEQSRRLFGVITAGGSLGALFGPIVTSVLVIPLGFQNILPISATFLLFSAFCVYQLRDWVRSRNNSENSPAESQFDKAIGGHALAGLTLVLKNRYFIVIATALLCANFLGGAMYLYMAQMISVTFEGADRQTQVFANMDAAINGLSFVGQLLIVKHSVKKLGIGWTLTLLPMLSIVGFSILALNPTFAVIAAFHVIRRALGFGFSKPTTDMLYSVVSPEAKYKAKNFIETTVYRGWDVVSSFGVRALGGIGLSGVALVCVPVAFIWMLLVRWIGDEYSRRDDAMNASAPA